MEKWYPNWNEPPTIEKISIFLQHHQHHFLSSFCLRFVYVLLNCEKDVKMSTNIFIFTSKNSFFFDFRRKILFFFKFCRKILFFFESCRKIPFFSNLYFFFEKNDKNTKHQCKYDKETRYSF